MPKIKKKYNVYGTVTGGAFLGQVEANSMEEALEIAEAGDLSVYFCHHCAKLCENAEITDFMVEVEEEKK
jgi:hypothetical protein